jgi:hypothetical protein
MHIEWNRITWYSKLVAIMVFLITIGIFFELGSMYGSAKTAISLRPISIVNPSASVTTGKLFGTWYWARTYIVDNGDGSTSTASDDFSIDLSHGTGTVAVVGSYTATHDNGNRIDGCPESDTGEEAQCILGNLSGNVANVSFVSSYDGNASGTARMEYDPQNDTLHWVIVRAPVGNFDAYAPADAVLTRAKASQ